MLSTPITSQYTPFNEHEKYTSLIGILVLVLKLYSQ